MAGSGGVAQGATVALLATGLLAAALSAGLFFAFSVLVMPGLGTAPPAVAVRAMQAINAAVRTPLFAFAFFGPLLLSPAAALTAWSAGEARVAGLALAGLLVYAAGTFGVTFAVNIPLNEALAAAVPASGDAAEPWRGFAARWTAWNHVRTLASLLCGGLLTAALARAWHG